MPKKRRYAKITTLFAALFSAASVARGREVIPSYNAPQINQNLYNNHPVVPNYPQYVSPTFSPMQPNGQQVINNPNFTYQNPGVHPNYVPVQTNPIIPNPGQMTQPYPSYNINNNQPSPFPYSVNNPNIPNQQNLPTVNNNFPMHQQPAANQKMKNKNDTVQNKQKTKVSTKSSSSVVDKLKTIGSNIPIKTLVGFVVGTAVGGFSGKKASGKNAAIGAVAGLAAGAVCDYITGDLVKFKNLFKKQSTNQLKPVKPEPITQNLPVPSISTMIRVDKPKLVEIIYNMDPELKDLVAQLKKLQNQYVRLMYAIKYSDFRKIDSSHISLLNKVAKIEDECLNTNAALKFISECAYCIYSIRNFQIKENSRYKFSEQNKIINSYLSRIPTLYTRQDLKDLIPRVNRCLSALIKLRTQQINEKKSKEPQIEKNNENFVEKTQKEEIGKPNVDHKEKS